MFHPGDGPRPNAWLCVSHMSHMMFRHGSGMVHGWLMHGPHFYNKNLTLPFLKRHFYYKNVDHIFQRKLWLAQYFDFIRIWYFDKIRIWTPGLLIPITFPLTYWLSKFEFLFISLLTRLSCVSHLIAQWQQINFTIT